MAVNTPHFVRMTEYQCLVTFRNDIYPELDNKLGKMMGLHSKTYGKRLIEGFEPRYKITIKQICCENPAVTMIVVDRLDIRPKVIVLIAIICLNESTMRSALNPNVTFFSIQQTSRSSSRYNTRQLLHKLSFRKQCIITLNFISKCS